MNLVEMIDDEFYDALKIAGCKFGLSEHVSIDLVKFIRHNFLYAHKSKQSRLFDRMCIVIAEHVIGG